MGLSWGQKTEGDGPVRWSRRFALVSFCVEKTAGKPKCTWWFKPSHSVSVLFKVPGWGLMWQNFLSNQFGNFGLATCCVDIKPTQTVCPQNTQDKKLVCDTFATQRYKVADFID